MGRVVLGVAGALLLIIGSVLWWRGGAPADGALPPPPAQGQGAGGVPMPEPPAASDKTREEKRFDRYDKDRDATVEREEYLASRRKAFARLDANGDGRLSFEEWSAKTLAKFAAADADRSGALTRAEFASTRAVRKARAARCACPD